MQSGRERRRQLLQGSLALAGVGLLAGCGNPPWPWPASRAAPMPRLGFLVSTAELAAPNRAFLAGLRDLGYVDGETIRIDYRFGGGVTARYRGLLAELVQLGPDVIMVSGDAAAQAAKGVTTTVAVVFVLANDPVGQGLVAGLAHPGGNLTGLLIDPVDADLVSKRLELVREVVPSLSRLALIWNDVPPAALTVTQAERAGRVLGLQVRPLKVGTRDEIDGAFETASR